jgi:hypothetical protein
MAHPVRKTLKVLGLTVAYTLLSVIGLVVLVLTFPPLRNFAVQQGVKYANGTLDGYTVAVKSVDRLDPWGLKVRGIQMFDDKKREIVNVPWVHVRIKPFALLKNTLHLTQVEVDGVRAHLYPSEPKPPEPEEPPGEPSTFTIRADRARIRGASLTTDWSGKTLHAVVGTLAAGGQWGPKPALALEQANVRVTADRDELLKLRTTQGNWKAESGGKVGIEAMVAGAPLTLDATIPALDDVEPWPIRDARLRISGVKRRTLALLGVTDGAELNTSLDLALDAKSQGDRLDATLGVRANRSRIAVDASADRKRYEVAVRVSPTKLDQVAGILPAMKLESALRVHATPGYDPDADSLIPKRVELSWSKLAIDDGDVPPGKLIAELPMPVVRLVSLTLQGLESAFAASGEFDTERTRGKANLDFRELELNKLGVLQARGVAGLVDGGIAASFAADRIQADGELEILEFAHPSVAIDRLDLKFDALGPPTSPHGNLNLRIAALKAQDVMLDQVTAEAQVTTKTLLAKLQVRGPDSLLNAEIGGQRTANDQMRVQGIGRGTIAKKDFRFDLRELLYGERGITVQELSLYSGAQIARITGAYDRESVVNAQLNVNNVDLAEWTALAGVQGISGEVDGVIKVQGKSAEPQIDTTLEFTNAQYRSELPVDAKLTAKGDLASRKGQVALSLKSGEKIGAERKAKKEMQSSRPLGMEAKIDLALPTRPRDLAKAAQNAKVTADVNMHMPVEQLSAVAGDALVGLEGVLDLNLHADGTLDDPTVNTELRAWLKLPEQEGDPFEAIKLTANISKEEGKVDLWTRDEEGELLTFNGFVNWPGGSPRAAIDHPVGWQDTRFKLNAELHPRRLDVIQGVFAYFSKLYALSLPLRAGARISFEGDQGKLDGSAQVQAVVFGDKLDGRCALGTQSALELDARLKQDRVEADLLVRTDGGGEVKGKVETRLALNALEGGEPVVGPATVTLDGKNIAIHKLPGLCNLADGDASFRLVASALGKQKPALDLQASIKNLRAQNSMPLDVNAAVKAGDKLASLRADLTSRGQTVGTIGASVPLSYPDGTTPTVLPNAPLDGRVRFTKLPLANVLAFTEAVGNVKGTASADLTVKGKVSDPYPEGYLTFEDVNMSIAALAQPIKQLNGRIEVRGRSVKIPKLTARDRDGRLKIEGFASLDQDLSGTAGLYLEADEFPLRQQGTVIGELTTRARLDMKIPDNLAAEAQLKILDGRIWLTGERGKNVQSLEAHPDVRFADEKVEQEATPAEEQAAGKETFTFASFKIRTEDDLWLMHNDFGIQVGVKMNLITGENGPELTGEANIHRGELKLMGKVFILQKDSAIRFTGPIPPDPELDITAKFNPPAGRALIVKVTGVGSAPILEFSGAATNAGEAVAVLTGLGQKQQSRSGGDPATDMAKVASSMTAGLLIMTARREFGDWVPMISVETNDQGRMSARAGFDASKLIPEWLDGFAKGAYVEGIIGSGQGSGASRSGMGVRLEVALPRDFITSLGLGTNSAWSADVAWSP